MLNVMRDIEIVFVSVKGVTICLRRYTVCEKVCEWHLLYWFKNVFYLSNSKTGLAVGLVLVRIDELVLWYEKNVKFNKKIVELATLLKVPVVF